MRHFLNTGADWIIQIDDDMVFEAQWVERMILRAEAHDIKIIGGLAFGDDHGQLFSTIMIPHPKEGGYLRAANWPKDGLVEVAATGAAMLAIHKDAALKIEKRYAQRAPYNWFEERVAKGRSFGEDVVFSERAKSCGFKLYIDTGNKTGHHKDAILTEAGYERMLRDKAFIIGPHGDWLARVMGYMNINARTSQVETHERWRIVVPRDNEEFAQTEWFTAQVIDTSEWTQDTDLPTWIMEKLRDLGIVRPLDRLREGFQKAGGIPALPEGGVTLDLGMPAKE
jgi:hypothetical protein